MKKNILKSCRETKAIYVTEIVGSFVHLLHLLYLLLLVALFVVASYYIGCYYVCGRVLLHLPSLLHLSFLLNLWVLQIQHIFKVILELFLNICTHFVSNTLFFNLVWKFFRILTSNNKYDRHFCDRLFFVISSLELHLM